MPIRSEPLNITSVERIKEATGCETIHYFKSLNSTNSWLIENGKCGDICISEIQTTGRGRRGNKWQSPQGNIYFSLCWCFDEIVEHQSLLGLITGIAIAEALSDIGLTAHGLKWPNDIFWQQKKLGGILLETVAQSDKVIIGIGLNVSLPSEIEKEIDQPVTSIQEALKATGDSRLSKEVLLVHLIKRLQSRLAEFKTLNFDDFIKSWKKWDILQGKQVSFYFKNAIITGEVVDIDQHGRIGILKQSGEVCFYSSADIKSKEVGST
jgi:BirA family biotin operon repressor/biotin-[acetyl-CoA-carboxylase] ligase